MAKAKEEYVQPDEQHIDWEQIEHDSCAIIANVKKDGKASHGNVKRTIEALINMGHRTGEIEGEGDGAGVQTDIPRLIWAKTLAWRGLRPSAVDDPYFTVGHIMIPHSERGQLDEIKRRALEILRAGGLDVLVEQPALTRPDALGPLARQAEPEFWQVACLPSGGRRIEDRDSFEIVLQLERELPVHIASFSKNSVIYKVRGDGETLRRYFPELRHPDFKSAITLAHGRYSTNTNSAAERAQMFSTLGHNGEINTIDKLTREAQALGFQLPLQGSDSQILDRVVESLMFLCGLSLMEVLEIIFPPVWTEIEAFPEELQEFYRYYRRAFGALAQGPAAIIARQGDEVVFSCDALGLRPLWFGETEKEFFASSEKGVVPLESQVRDPEPLAPGEKMGFLLKRDRGVEVFKYHDLQKRLVAIADKRFDLEAANRRVIWASESLVVGSVGMKRANRVCAPPLPSWIRHDPFGSPGAALAVASEVEREKDQAQMLDAVSRNNQMLASGWTKDDVENLRVLAETCKEPISGLGYDGPLAALSRVRKNISDYFLERVAVVTNPSIDCLREADHFSTTTFLGPKPSLDDRRRVTEQIELRTPLLLGGAPRARHEIELQRKIAREAGARLIEDIEPLATTLEINYSEGASLKQALAHLQAEAEKAVREGAAILILDDSGTYEMGRLPIDSHLALAAVDQRLRACFVDGESLRRRCSLVLKSQQLRNFHDLAMAVGCGADAVNPYRIFDAVLEMGNQLEDKQTKLRNCLKTLQSGIEKVISTMGIHELEGYGRIFASIGLAPEISAYFGVKNYYGSNTAGLNFARLEADARERLKIGSKKERLPLAKDFHFYPYIWKTAGQAARGDVPYQTYADKLDALEKENPVSLRHLLDFKTDSVTARLDESQVDISVGSHAAPIIFSAMSFGAQGETSFRAFAEAAKRLGIVGINGEGGELLDIMGKYRQYRGQQVASARFGVNIAMLNSADFIEIKIGQGAKPGEGGHLPGFKVTAKIAETRHTPPGIDLISPSNNHDIYSIEDLAQLIEELKTANPRARISVKIPSVPHIGAIATGIAKARADIIGISGYDGGTGAARKHATRYVGIPVEIGLREAHLALLHSGLRNRVEIWADGGVKSGKDVVKLMLLGANRVGFGTLVQVAIGCTICRECNTGTCHVGITSQLKSPEEALEKGQKHFVPRDYYHAVEHATHLFSEVCNEIRSIVARLGERRAQDLVGKAGLLYQARMRDRIDLSKLLRDTEETLFVPEEIKEQTVGRARKPLTSLTRVVTSSVFDMIEKGKEIVIFEDSEVSNTDRSMGTHLAGQLVYARQEGRLNGFKKAILKLREGVTPGNGLGAFNSDGIDIIVEGGVQDGAAKSASGGRVAILKGINHDGIRIDGSVGKCFAYGAQAGTLIVQGNADSRAGIRLSGADLIIGGRVREPLRDELGNIASRANIKGFAFEYQTSGRGMVLGDPGPWLCSGMTGGVVYLRIDETVDLTVDALRRRLARGASVRIMPVAGPEDEKNIKELLTSYASALRESNQRDEANEVMDLTRNWSKNFVKVVPVR